MDSAFTVRDMTLAKDGIPAYYCKEQIPVALENNFRDGKLISFGFTRFEITEDIGESERRRKKTASIAGLQNVQSMMSQW